jgi:hypothetical protein
MLDRQPADESDVCYLCERSSSDWLISDEKVEFKQYGVAETHCLSCHSLFQGSFELFGAESFIGTNKDIPKANKLGMLSTGGALVTPSSTTLFMSTTEKYEKAKKPPFKLEAIKPTDIQLRLLDETPEVPEFLFISGVGRDKKKLIDNLKLSSPEKLVICSEGGIVEIPVHLHRDLKREASKLTPRKRADLKTALIHYYQGEISINDEKLGEILNGAVEEIPGLIQAITRLPADPHEAIDTIRLSIR